MRKLMIVSVVLLGACGAEAVSLDDYSTAFRDAECRYRVRCGAIESLDICRQANLGVAGDNGRVTASGRAAIDMGKAEFDGEAAHACLEERAARSCDLTTRSNRVRPDSCLQIISGTLHGGERCAQDIECRSLQCNVPACGMACCSGTCTGDVVPAPAKLGESCKTSRCEDTAFCDRPTTTCVALHPEGAPCTSEDACELGLACVFRGGSALVCAALPKLGEACTDYCREEGTTCNATSKTCVKVALAGEACTADADCTRIYRCDPNQHCSPGLAVGAGCHLGDACTGDGGFCDAPSNDVMGTCSLPKANGSACKDDSDCQSRTCDPQSKVCVAEPVCI